MDVVLEGMEQKTVKYTKRPKSETKKLRREFNSKERENFLKQASNDPNHVEKLKKAGLDDKGIQKMRDGKVPEGYQVHHKLPLDDNGDNSFDNLVLIKNDPYHKAVTNLQNDLTRGMVENQTETIRWPMPKGIVYPE